MPTSGKAAGYSGGLTIRNLGAFRRDLRKLDRGLDLGLSRYIRDKVRPVRDDARKRTPVGRSSRRSAKQRKPGTLQKSIKSSITQKRATLYSNEPDAGVHEFGGVITPRGVPIEIREVAMLRGAVANWSDEVEADMGGMFDHLAGLWPSH